MTALLRSGHFVCHVNKLEICCAELNDAAPSTSAPADGVDIINDIDDVMEEAPARKNRKAAVFDSDEEEDAPDAAPDAVQQEPTSGAPADVNMAQELGSDEDEA